MEDTVLACSYSIPGISSFCLDYHDQLSRKMFAVGLNLPVIRRGLLGAVVMKRRDKNRGVDAGSLHLVGFRLNMFW